MASQQQRLRELLRLSREERSELAEALLESLEEDEQEASSAAAWAEEIARRIARNAPGIPADTVFGEGRARLSGDE